MGSKISINLRGACKVDVPFERNEDTGKIYASGGCANPEVKKGMSPDSLRGACFSCPHKDENLGKNLSVHDLLDEMGKVPLEEQAAPLPLPKGGNGRKKRATKIPVKESTDKTPSSPPATDSAPVSEDGETGVAGAPEPEPESEVVTTPAVATVSPPAALGGESGTTSSDFNPASVAVDGCQGDTGSQFQVEGVGAPPPASVTPPGQGNILVVRGDSAKIGQSYIPGMNLEGMDESELDIDEVLSVIPELSGGPSVGGFSNSLLDTFECPRKTYYTYVLGLVGKGGHSKALQIGTLVHACFELHYLTGGQRTFEPCDLVQKAGGTEIAAEARRYVKYALDHWGQTEAETWDVRGVEVQGVWHMEPVRIGGKQVRIPLTCRHDLLVALREPGGPCAPPGPVPHGVYILDHKTAKSLTYDLTKGYTMDPQFLMNALIYSRGEAERYGPLNGVIVSIIGKHVKMRPESLFRETTATYPELVEEFYQHTIKPKAIELYSKLVDKQRNDREFWPKNQRQCVKRYGLCPFWNLCDTESHSVDYILEQCFTEDPGRQLDISTFIEAPKVAGAAATATVEDEKALKRRLKKEWKEQVLGVLVRYFETLDYFKPTQWIWDGRKRADTLAALQDYISKMWTAGTKFDMEGASYEVAIRHIKIKQDDNSCTVGWKALATAISAPWWDPAKSEPISG